MVARDCGKDAGHNLIVKSLILPGCCMRDPAVSALSRRIPPGVGGGRPTESGKCAPRSLDILAHRNGRVRPRAREYECARNIAEGKELKAGQK